MEIQELPHREFKIIIKRMLRELQQTTDMQSNNSRKTIQEQNKFLKEVENIIKASHRNFGAEEYTDCTKELNREL